MLKQKEETTKPKLENHKELPPAHMQAPLEPMQLPLNQCNSPWTNACQPLEENRATASAQLCPVKPVNTTDQTSVQLVNRASTLTGQTGVQQSLEMARNHLKTFLMHPVARNKLKLLPLVHNA
jgi:hypothetical protein